jgi:hypothetical protein
VGGAHVCATEVQTRVVWEPAVTCVYADRGGRYRIAVAGGSAFFVSAEAEGYLPGSAASGQPVVVPAAAEISGLDITLESGGVRLAGLVLDATGGPISGALVRTVRARATGATFSLRSGDRGQFAVTTAPGPVTVIVDASGYAPTRVYRTAPANDVIVRLVPAAGVSGTVVASQDGHPLPNMRVRALPFGALSAAAQAPVLSGDDGSFSVMDLEPGQYTFVAEGDGIRGTSELVELALAERRQHVTIAANAATTVAGGVLVAPAGEPCRQGTVTLGPGTPGRAGPLDAPDAAATTASVGVPALLATIDANGQVRFDAVPAGTYHVVVECIDHVLVDGPIQMTIGTEPIADVVWTVSEGARLTVRFVDELDRPVAAATGFLLLPDRGGPRVRVPIRADAQGRYIHPAQLYPGTYSILPNAGYEADPTDFEVRRAPVEAVLHMRGHGGLFVQVRTDRGDPVDDLSVYATRSAADSPDAEAPQVASPIPNTSRRISAVALGAGRFRIAPIATGRYDVHATDGINAPFSIPDRGGPVEVTPGRDVELGLVLERGATITGHVVDGNRQAMPDAAVRARCAPDTSRESGPPVAFDSPAHRVVSDADGAFVLAGLARDAVCTVEAEGRGGLVGVEPAARPGRDVVLTLPEPARLHGVAFWSGAAPEDHFQLLVQPASGRPRQDLVKVSDGRWTLTGVQPGKVHIEAQTAAALAQTDIDVRPGDSSDEVRLEFRPAPWAQRQSGGR